MFTNLSPLMYVLRYLRKLFHPASHTHHALLTLVPNDIHAGILARIALACEGEIVVVTAVHEREEDITVDWDGVGGDKVIVVVGDAKVPLVAVLPLVVAVEFRPGSAAITKASG